MKKRRVKVVLKRATPEDPVRARHLADVRTLQMRLTLGVEAVMREGSIAELSSLAYLLQGFDSLLYHGGAFQRHGKDTVHS